MERNVLTWAKALETGLEPRLYPYGIDEVLQGEYEAILDFKIWAKKVMGINCYFTHADSQQKFRLTVYCDGLYRIKGSGIDFACSPTGRKYRLTVTANQKKNIVFYGATLLNDDGLGKEVVPTVNVPGDQGTKQV